MNIKKYLKKFFSNKEDKEDKRGNRQSNKSLTLNGGTFFARTFNVKNLHKVTFQDGEVRYVDEDENVYMGEDVSDEGAKGFSTVGEIVDTLEEIDEDYNKREIIDRDTLESRLNFLAFIISRIKEGELGSREEKIEALKKINTFREKNGFKKFKMESYISK